MWRCDAAAGRARNVARAFAKLHAGEKQAIGGTAAGLTENGQTVHLGPGATTFLIARNLTHKKGPTIIGGAINIINHLVNFPSLVLVTDGSEFGLKRAARAIVAQVQPETAGIATIRETFPS